MTSGKDDLIRAFLADEARIAMAAAPSLDEAVGRLAPRIEGRPRRASQRLIVPLAATLLLVAALGTALAVGSGILRLPLVNDSPFHGIWVSTSDNDGGIQTMYVRVSAGGGVEITVHDNVAAACSGTRSAMTGTGRIEGGTQLVIPAPVYTCDDGSEPRALSGPPLEEQLRNLTFVHDPENDVLTVRTGSVWRRPGAPDPSSAWPQTSLEEVREAQRLADAGDPAYTWQVDPEMEANVPNVQIVERFLREELGWEQFLFNPWVGWDETFSNLTYIRCASGGTNPLYPNDEWGGGCAPTIDDLRYETVQIDLAQPARQGPSGIWVVTRWATISPFEQVVPPVAEAETLLEDFLQARIEGESAEEHVDLGRDDHVLGGLPLLYATSTGAPYERYEFERAAGPHWPFGSMEFKVRLFAEGGETAVEQRFLINNETGRLRLGYRDGGDTAPTTENGQAVPVTYLFLDGEVTGAAAWPWEETWFNTWGLLLGGSLEERLELIGDPWPVETGCGPGPAPANAEALARTIRSDPDLEATAPVAVRVGGIEALEMDVVAAPGASVCEAVPAPMVLKADKDESYHGLAAERGSRIRLYLLDLPEGSSIRILAIAIVAPEARFERVMEAAAPVLDSLEFQAR